MHPAGAKNTLGLQIEEGNDVLRVVTPHSGIEATECGCKPRLQASIQTAACVRIGT